VVQLDSSRSITSIVTRKGQVCSYGLRELYSEVLNGVDRIIISH